jgi:hypothetical protein
LTSQAPGYVFTPRPAHLVTLLEDHEAVDAGLEQLDARAQAAEPRTDDGNLDFPFALFDPCPLHCAQHDGTA